MRFASFKLPIRVALSLPLLYAVLLPTPVLAEDMTSSSYRLIFGNFNMTSGNKSSASYHVSDTVGQTAPGQYGTGMMVKAGFQYIFPMEEFTFKITPLSIAFGSLNIGAFATANQFIEITAIGAGGYSVKVAEDHPLKQTSGSNTIPDTACDTTCSEIAAGNWTNPLRPGFGYNMSGDDANPDFTNGNMYKQFADRSLGEDYQMIMSSTHVATKRHGVLTYKLAIGGSQASGDYATQLTYLAIPGY